MLNKKPFAGLSDAGYEFQLHSIGVLDLEVQLASEHDCSITIHSTTRCAYRVVILGIHIVQHKS
jgi:hypothetical protein